MALDYRNPNDWGRCSLTDNALKLQQFKALNPTATKREINSFLCSLYLPFTVTEFLATHETIDDHPYSAAFGQFLGNGIEERYCKYLSVWL